MSAQTSDITNYLNKVTENKRNENKSYDLNDDSFSKTFEKAQSRVSNSHEDRKAERHSEKRNTRKEEYTDKTAGTEETQDSKKEDRKDKYENNKITSDIENETILTNLTDTAFIGTEEIEADADTQNDVKTTDVKGDTVKQSERTNGLPTVVDAQKITREIEQTNLIKTAIKAEENSSVKQVSNAIASDIEPESGVQIKASEQVAAAAKEKAVTQSQDMSTHAKNKVITNLESVAGTDTTVVESKTGSGTESKNNGSSFSQGNASEQVIKLSIENANPDKSVNPGDFSTNLENKIQTASAQKPVLEINKSDVMNQINSKLSDLPQSANSKVTIILKPENLGRIHLEIVNTAEGITAKMLTDNQQVKDLLDKNMETLKSQLGAQGVNVSNIKVETSNHTSNNAMNFEREAFNQDFSGNSGNHNTGGSNETNETNRFSGTSQEDGFEEIEGQQNVRNESKIVHDGKIDYKI